MELMKLTAAELGKKIQAGEVTAVEAAEAALKQIKERDKELNCFVTVDEEGALRRAARVQEKIEKGELIFIVLSGFATGASWLCYYHALQEGLASVVVPIDKLSILITIIFSWLVLKEKLSKKALAGIISIVLGTMLLIF